MFPFAACFSLLLVSLSCCCLLLSSPSMALQRGGSLRSSPNGESSHRAPRRPLFERPLKFIRKLKQKGLLLLFFPLILFHFPFCPTRREGRLSYHLCFCCFPLFFAAFSFSLLCRSCSLAKQPWRSNPGEATLAKQPWRSNPGEATLAKQPWRSWGVGPAPLPFAFGLTKGLLRRRKSKPALTTQLRLSVGEAALWSLAVPFPLFPKGEQEKNSNQRRRERKRKRNKQRAGQATERKRRKSREAEG